MDRAQPKKPNRGFVANRIVRALLSTLMSILLAASLVGAGLFVCSIDFATQTLSENFSRWENSGFSKEQMVRAALASKDYTVNSNDRVKFEAEIESTLEISPASSVIDERVLDHLDDVFKVVNLARIVLIVAFVATLGVGLFNLFALGRALLGASMRAAAVLIFALFAIIALWGVLDFDGFFTVLHTLFFVQGSWLFNSDSLLIRMYPIEFWVGMGVVWLCTTLLGCLICFILGRKIRGRKTLR